MSAPSGRVVKICRILIRGPVFVCFVCCSLADCLLHACLRRLDPATGVAIVNRWSRRCLSCLRVQVSTSGAIPAHGLIVSNHLSYLDIFVFSAVAPCLFVAKSEIKSWPLVGWVTRMTGNVFVDRRPAQTGRPQSQMQEELTSGRRLVLFPEATSTDGRELLPFRSSLFQAAVLAGSPITAAYLSYELPEGDGDPVMDVYYWGDMTLFPQLLKLLTKTRVNAIVRFSDNPKAFSDRKQAAREMQREVAELGNTAKSAAQMALP